MSILYFYNRVFPQKWFKYSLIALGLFISGHMIAFNFVAIFQCRPIRSQWNPSIPSHCLNYEAAILIGGIVNILTDFVMLIIPMPLLWGLKLSKSRKLMLTSVFLLGGG